MITRVPQKEEWARVQRVARRVQGLNIPESDSIDEERNIHAISYESMNILRDHYPDAVLFPNLRELSIESWFLEPFYRLFMSPRLRYVNLVPCLHESTMALVTALDAASPSCNLQDLCVGDWYIGYGHGVEITSLVAPLSRVICRQTCLACVIVPSHVSEEALVHLAHTPSLEYLAIDFYGAAYHGILKPSRANFSHLKRLFLQAGYINEDTAALTSFLGAFAYATSLEQLELNFATSYFSFFTLGGLRTSTDGEVLGRDGRAVPGLFAAGRCTSGLPAWGAGYSSGLSLADCTFFGRQAGRKAAAG